MNTATATTDWSSIADAPGLDESRFSEDSRLGVSFYRKPVLQTGASAEAGRAIYKEVDYIKIMIPGDKLLTIDEPVNDINRRRFADKYAKWQAGAGNAVEGTPLTALPKMTPSKVEEYKFFNITTVEQLAGASDAVGQKFFGFSEDKRAANNFIELAKGNAPLVKMNEELKERDAKIEEMQEQIASLTRMMGSKKSGKAEKSED